MGYKGVRLGVREVFNELQIKAYYKFPVYFTTCKPMNGVQVVSLSCRRAGANSKHALHPQLRAYQTYQSNK